MITGEQIKAARKLLGWSASMLAVRSHRTAIGVARAEAGKLEPRRVESSLRTIQAALERAGIEFTDEQPGVRLRNAL